MQPAGKRLAARRASEELAIANSSECNNADDRFPTGPKGAPQIGQCGVAYRDIGQGREQERKLCSPCKGPAIPCGLRLALANLGSSAA
jgi:hypothetical protein